MREINVTLGERVCVCDFYSDHLDSFYAKLNCFNALRYVAMFVFSSSFGIPSIKYNLMCLPSSYRMK